MKGVCMMLYEAIAVTIKKIGEQIGKNIKRKAERIEIW